MVNVFGQDPGQIQKGQKVSKLARYRQLKQQIKHTQQQFAQLERETHGFVIFAEFGNRPVRVVSREELRKRHKDILPFDSAKDC